MFGAEFRTFFYIYNNIWEFTSNLKLEVNSIKWLKHLANSAFIKSVSIALNLALKGQCFAELESLDHLKR
jgi:hypothetical protein